MCTLRFARSIRAVAWEEKAMMTLLFALFSGAMILAYQGKLGKANWVFAGGLVLSLFWLNYHSTSTLGIAL